jgi:hypothetical protein
MPDGTIQDSRMPQSPQWGYLKVRDPQQIPLGKRRCSQDKWNEYVLFLHDCKKNKKVTKKRKRRSPDPAVFYKRNVSFEMIDATITAKGLGKVKIKVAKVTGILDCDYPKETNCRKTSVKKRKK